MDRESGPGSVELTPTNGSVAGNQTIVKGHVLVPDETKDLILGGLHSKIVFTGRK